MNRFEELLTSIYASPAMVVHLGAGSAKEYDLYKSLDANQIIFVEPDQRLAEQAIQKFKGMSNVKVINYAITNGEGPQLFNIISNPRFSSLLEPAELLDFYPNITVTDSVNVETITLEKLCLNNKIEDQTENLLVAELQGSEKEVFSSTPKSTLAKFKWIVISSSEHQLYKPVSNDTQKDLVQLMRDAGFIVFNFKEDASPYTNIMCVRNGAIIRNVQMRARVAELDRSIVALENQVSEQKSELSGLQLESNRRISDFEEALKSKSNELQTRTDELNAKHEELNAKTVNLNVKNEELKSVSNELTDAKNQIQLISKERDKLALDVTNNANELSEMQQTLRINNKLMLKSEADLGDLQNQYRITLQHQEQQHLLFSELKEKLGQASKLYRKLNLRNFVLDGDALNQNEPQDVDPVGNDDLQS